MKRYVLDAAQPFIVRTDMHKSNAGCAFDINDTVRTITRSGGIGLVEPTLAPVESSEAFLDAYASARGENVSAYELEVAWAASILVALHNARDELIFNRPRLTYTRLEAQHDERLSRANAP